MSVLKKQKYFYTKKIYEFLNVKENNIILFSHLNNLNTNEDFLLRSFCKEHNIKILLVKLNLINKITINKTLSNIFKGPTVLFLFENFNYFLTFSTFIENRKWLIPLTIYWKNELFCYFFFLNKVKNYSKNNSILNNSYIKIKFIQNLNSTFQNFLLRLNFNKLFLLLNLYILKNK